jgi:hypothetical protein
MADSGRLMQTTPRSIGAPAPIKRKHLALRSPRGGYDTTTPRAATQPGSAVVPKMPVPPTQPREAGTQSTASARGFRPLVRDGINPSKHRAPVPEELYATLAQEVRSCAVGKGRGGRGRMVAGAADNADADAGDGLIVVLQVPPELADPADWRVMAETYNVGPMVRTQVSGIPSPFPSAPSFASPSRPSRKRAPFANPVWCLART